MKRERALGLLAMVTTALVVVLVASNGGLAAGAQKTASNDASKEPTAASLIGVVTARNLPPPRAQAQMSRRFLHPGGDASLTSEKLAAARLPSGSGIATASASVATAAPTASGFEGISYADTICGCMPPDGAIAAGPSNLIGAVNTAYEVWDKRGNLLLGPADLGTFFLGCNIGYVSDPFVDYDAAANRFVIGILSFDFFYDSSICIAVTQTGDPTGNWNVYSIPVNLSKRTGGDLLDFPHLGISSDAFYVAGNQFKNMATTYIGPRVYAFNKSQMYAGLSQAGGQYVNITDTSKDTLQPAHDVGTAKTMYFVSVDNNCPCSNAYVWKWYDPWGADSFSYQGATALVSYSEPPNAVEPGGGQITTNDARVLGAQWTDASGGTSLYGVHTIACNPGSGTVACVDWFQIGNLDSTPSLVDEGTIFGDGQDKFFPNVAVNKAGEVAIGFAFSSSADYAGVHAADLRSGTEIVLKAGETTIDGSRYGDYAGTVLDPDGCTIWHLEEYAEAGTTWGTWVNSLAYSDCTSGISATPTATPTASTLTPTATATSPSTTPTPSATPKPCPPGKQKHGLC